MKICGIYKITSPAGRVYIGQSVDIKRRFVRYRGLDCKGQPILYRSFLKHGVENHVFEILCQCPQTELDILEKFYIELYQCFDTAQGMNMLPGGRINGEFSQEARKKISDAHRGEKNHWYGKSLPAHVIQKAIAANQGEKLSVVHRQKLSESHRGKKYKMTEAGSASIAEHSRRRTKERIAALGYHISPETAKKISEANTGSKRSALTRKKMSAKLMGNKNSLGAKRSAETRKKLTEANLRRWARYRQEKANQIKTVA